MKRYAVKEISEGSKKFYYILDCDTFELVPLPSKYLKYKISINCSPNTVERSARSLSYYWGYITEQKIDIADVCELDFENQSNHFVQFLYWLKEGRHIDNSKMDNTGNGTCNAYLRDVFRFFLYTIDCGYLKPLKVLSYNQMVVPNEVGIKRTLRIRSFAGYLKEDDRNVRAAEEIEIIEILQACTNCRDQVLLLLIAESGFRIEEILGLDYTKDIDYNNRTIRVFFRDDNENDARAKNAECRRAKLSEETFQFLLHYMSEYRHLLQYQTYLFINIAGENAGKPLKVESVYDMLARMEKKTGVKLTPHMLRRYFAVTRRKAGWELEMVCLALGHKHIDTTIKYLGLLEDKLIEASKEFYARHSDVYGIEKLL